MTLGTVTLAGVLTQRTADAILESLFVRAEAKQLNARGYSALHLARVLFELEAATEFGWQDIVFALASGGFPATAVGAWLDLVAAGWFDEARGQPLTTIVQLRLSDSAGQGPYTLSNPIAVAYPSSATPLYYRSIDGSVTVPRNGFVDATFIAEASGAVYNVAPGQIVDLATPTPGVTLTSPALPGEGVIILASGADEEGDDSLRARLRDKWSLLGRGWMAATIRALVRQCDPSITRILVLDPGPVPGVADAVLATATGPVTPAQALAVYLYLADPARKPVSNYPVRCRQAGSRVVPLSISLWSDGTNPSIIADAAARLLAYQDSLAPGEAWRLSRVIDAVVEPADGAIGAHVTNINDPLLETGLVGSDEVVSFVPTFEVVS